MSAEPNDRELTSLNDGPLGDQELEDVAGGAMTDCGTFTCGTYSENQQ